MIIDEVIVKLKKLNQSVPQPLRLPTEEEISKAESTLGTKFHPDYRHYLLHASDVVYGIKEPCTALCDGTNTDVIEVAQSAWNLVDLPRQLMPICEDIVPDDDHFLYQVLCGLCFCATAFNCRRTGLYRINQFLLRAF